MRTTTAYPGWVWILGAIGCLFPQAGYGQEPTSGWERERPLSGCYAVTHAPWALELPDSASLRTSWNVSVPSVINLTMSEHTLGYVMQSIIEIDDDGTRRDRQITNPRAQGRLLKTLPRLSSGMHDPSNWAVDANDSLVVLWRGQLRSHTAGAVEYRIELHLDPDGPDHTGRALRHVDSMNAPESVDALALRITCPDEIPDPTNPPLRLRLAPAPRDSIPD